MANESARPETASISVYKAGDAVIHERRLVQLRQGANQVLIQGLPASFADDSFQVYKVEGPAELKLGADSFSPAELSIENLLKKSVGSQITLREDTRSRALIHKGILRFVQGDQLVLETSEGVQVVKLGTNFTLSEMPAGLRQTPTLSVEANATAAGDYTLHSLYEAGGLSWTAMYSLFYDAVAGKFKTLQCRVKISNNTGANFDNVLVHLLNGTNSSRARSSNQRGAYESVSKFAMTAGAASDMVATVESLGDQKLYTLPDPLSIEHGQTKRPYLIVKRDIPVRSEYFVEPLPYRLGALEKHPVKVRLLVDNSTENNLGVDLPAGEAAIFQTDKLGQEQKTEHSLPIEQLAAGEELRVTLNTPCAELKATRQLVESKEDPEHVNEAADSETKEPRYRVEERKLELSNFKDENVCVSVEEELPGVEFEILHSDQRFAQQSLHQGVFIVEVPANGSCSISYGLKWRVA